MNLAKIFFMVLVLVAVVPAQAYTRWTIINPWEVCQQSDSLKFLVGVNTGAGFMEFHRFRREFVRNEPLP